MLRPGRIVAAVMKSPRTPELRNYLLDLVREERTLERLYRLSHSPEQIAEVRVQWKASYRSLRDMLALQDSLVRSAPTHASRGDHTSLGCVIQVGRARPVPAA